MSSKTIPPETLDIVLKHHAAPLAVMLQRRSGWFRWLLIDPEDLYEPIWVSNALKPEHLPGAISQGPFADVEVPPHILRAWPRSLQKADRRVILTRPPG